MSEVVTTKEVSSRQTETDEPPPTYTREARRADRTARREVRQGRRSHNGHRNGAEASRQKVVRGGLLGGQYRPLKQAELERIHAASLTVLERTGIEVMPSECREIFRSGGAQVDDERNRVYIPRSMVEDALSTVRHEVTLCGRDPAHDLDLGGTRVYMGTGGAAVKVLDLDGRVRQSTLADVYSIGRLVDALENIHFYLRACVARDIPSEALDINTYYAALRSTTKHVMGNCFTVQSVRDVLELGAMLAGSEAALRARPFLSFITCWTVSPLRYAPETVEVLTEVVRQGMPVVLSTAPQAGATSPAALAGTLVQVNAEILSGIAYTQLLNPGAPVVAGYVTAVADLRTGNFVGGAPEVAMMSAAAAQLGQFYGLPVYNSSAISDAKVPDIQAGYEKGMTSLAAALAGSNFIHHSAGFLESMLTVAYEQYVIDDDINGAVLRMVRGIEVNDDTLSVDLIDQVCRGDNHYLGTQQSLQFMNTEYYYPHTADRHTREDWESNGSLEMRERARRQAMEILRRHYPQTIPSHVEAAIRARFPIMLNQ